MSVNGVRPVTRPWQCGARFALLLFFALTLHQLVMLSPMHEHVMPMIFPVENTLSAPHLNGAMPSHDQPVIEECPATVAALFQTLMLLFLLLFCLALARTVLTAVITERVTIVHWLWPPNRRRALLQVFLC